MGIKKTREKIAFYLNLEFDMNIKPNDIFISVIENNIEITYKGKFIIEGLDLFFIEEFEEIKCVLTGLDKTMNLYFK